MKGKLMMLLACLFMGTSLVTAQTTKVTGVVIGEEDGEPVIGATITVKGVPTLGTITDLDGKFILDNLPSNAKTLVISYVGMKTQEVAVRPYVKVELMSDAEVLEDVIITGYGSAKKLGSVVGSAIAVSGEKLENIPVANIGDALQGQVAGLQVYTSSGEPSAGVSIRLRGVSSISSSSEPLFILDGSPISSGAFTALNPNDIESMTVLKDASSTAIYGSRAANGVVILTSKKGKKGQKAKINVSAQYGISQMTGDNAQMMNAEQWLNFQEILDPSMKENAEFQKSKNFVIDNGISTDWADIFFGGTAPTKQLDVNVVGGNDILNYYLSMGHYDAEGIMDDSDMRRETFRSNIEATVNSWMKVGANANLSYQKFLTAAFSESGSSPYNKAFAARTNRPDDSYYEILTDKNGKFLGYGDRLDYFVKMNDYNPYYLSEIQPASNDMVRLNGNTYININPIKGLNIRAAQGVEAFDYRYSYVALPTGPFEGMGMAAEQYQRSHSFTFTNTAEYKFNVAGRNDFSFLIGQEAIMSKTDAFSVNVDGLTDPRLILMSTASTPNLPAHSKSEKVFNSYFATFGYCYGDKYFVDASFRRDGSSLFAENHRWGNFWSAGAMWNITQENFMRNVSWMNKLQLKASYGSVGNSSGLSPYMALGLIGTGPLYNGQSGTATANPANPDLTWEVMKSTNIALSSRVFNLVDLDLEFYNRKTEDMLMSIPYSYTTGFSSGWGNVASMRNRGLDATANVDILQNYNGVNWSVSANVNYNQNEITSLFNGMDEYVIANTGLKLQVGKPYGEYFYTRWAGVDPRDGYNMWYDKDGNLTKQYSEEDAVFTGKQRYAPFTGGFGTRFSWKGLSVGADFAFVYGQYMLNNERWFTENPQFASQNNQTLAMLTMWQKPGDITNISTPESSMQFDTHLLEDASFMRLKNLTVSYTLPQSWMRKTNFMGGCRVYFVGRNLLTFTKYQGYDPEVDSNVQIGNYPNTKQYTLGLELTF